MSVGETPPLDSHPADAVLLDDEAELDDVRALLTELGVSFSDALPEGGHAELPLLVTTPAWALELQRQGSAPPLLHVVVADERRHGPVLGAVHCDFVLRRPLDPTVVRLLADRAAYGGPERRRATRVAVGVPVRAHCDGRELEAVLAQLSIRGCGLVTHEPLAAGCRVALALPGELTGERPLALEGRVIGSRETASADGRGWDVSVVFDEIDIQGRVTLRAVMARHPVDFRPGPRVQRRPPPLAARTAERRQTARRRYRRPVPTEGESGVRLLMGRDLSPGGMRIDRDPALALGDALVLTLHGGAGRVPVVVEAVVARDDGDDGWFLRFAELSEEAARDLQALLASLAPLDLLATSGPRPGVVLSEVRERSS